MLFFFQISKKILWQDLRSSIPVYAVDFFAVVTLLTLIPVKGMLKFDGLISLLIPFILLLPIYTYKLFYNVLRTGKLLDKLKIVLFLTMKKALVVNVLLARLTLSYEILFLITYLLLSTFLFTDFNIDNLTLTLLLGSYFIAIFPLLSIFLTIELKRFSISRTIPFSIIIGITLFLIFKIITTSSSLIVIFIVLILSIVLIYQIIIKQAYNSIHLVK